MSKTNPSIINLLLESYRQGLVAVHPRYILDQHLPTPPRNGRIIVIGGGKAAGAMAEAVEKYYQNKHSVTVEGTVVSNDITRSKTQNITVCQGSHPVPCEKSAAAAQKILEQAQSATKKDIVIGLISGGGSALMSLPTDGISIEDLQNINGQLVKSGAHIHEMNIVRKHLSKISGGRLAVAAKNAKHMTTLMISDVTDDDMSIIASGPTVPDPSTQEEAWEIIKRHNIQISPAAQSVLNNPDYETPTKEHPAFLGERNTNIIAAKNALAMQAIADYATDLGFEVIQADTQMTDTPEQEAKKHISTFLATATRKKPAIYIAGGEPDIQPVEGGVGGRYNHLALALALEAQKTKRRNTLYGVSAGTDGADYYAATTGAIFTPDTINQAKKLGLKPKKLLKGCNSLPFVAATGSGIITGHTNTNVNGFIVLLDMFGHDTGKQLPEKIFSKTGIGYQINIGL